MQPVYLRFYRHGGLLGSLVSLLGRTKHYHVDMCISGTEDFFTLWCYDSAGDLRLGGGVRRWLENCPVSLRSWADGGVATALRLDCVEDPAAFIAALDAEVGVVKYGYLNDLIMFLHNTLRVPRRWFTGDPAGDCCSELAAKALRRDCISKAFSSAIPENTTVTPDELLTILSSPALAKFVHKLPL